jgi:TolB-like protein
MAGVDTLAARAALERILASKAFAHAPRLRALLPRLVDFAADDSPGLVSVDAVDVSRLASRLDLYYQQEGQSDSVRIRLDAKSLVPVVEWPQDSPPPVAPPLIAILPFQQTSADHEYLADGITEFLINSLSRLEGLRVLARSSTFQFKARSSMSVRAPSQIGANYIVQGALRVSGSRLRIEAELLEGAGGWLLWSESYERPVEEILSIQDEILASVTDALRTEQPETGFFRHGLNNPLAYDDYLRGRLHWYLRTEESLRKAVGFFEAAISKEEGSALPHCALAECHVALAINDLDSSLDAMRQAKAAARAALDLDPELPEALTVMGCIRSIFDWDWEGGATDLLESIRRSPRAPNARYLYALLNLAPRGLLTEAVAEMEIVTTLDPHSPLVRRDAGVLSFLRRDYDAALQAFRKTQDYHGAHFWLARVYIELRRFEEAIDELEAQQAAGQPNNRALSLIAHTYGRMGRRGQAEQALRQLRERSRVQRVAPLDFAQPLIGLGRQDEALSYLRQAIAERAVTLFLFQVDPIYDPVRRDGRAQAILAAMNFTSETA